jgi:hypothetical protein
VEEARSHQSVDWFHYFKSIRKECPWSYAAYVRGELSIIPFENKVLPLGDFEARMYCVELSPSELEALSEKLNASDADNEWLFSYPEYGDFATPIPVLIQQNRKKLNDLRENLQ